MHIGQGELQLKKVAILFVLILLLTPFPPANAEPSPCVYSTISDAYIAADTVVIGTVAGLAGTGTDLMLSMENSIKGNANPSITILGQRPFNTENNGFSLTVGLKVLLLRKKSPDGIYDSVEDYNSACYSTYFVEEGNVILPLRENGSNSRTLSIPINEIKAHLAGLAPHLRPCKNYASAWQPIRHPEAGESKNVYKI